jgi:hypothetical protein
MDVFGDMANRGRVREESEDDEGDWSDDDSGDGSDGGHPNGDDFGNVNYHPQGDGYPESAISEYVERPSPGFETIEEERNALMFKIHRAIRGGMPVEAPGFDKDIRDLRSTVATIENEVALDRSIKFQRRMICMLTSSIEWVSGRYEWADLDGWSDSVATSISDYDDIFTELHEKYRGTMNLAPELRLVLSLATSMFWFNLTRSMTKQLTNSLSGGVSKTGGNQSGGGFDISSILGMMGGMKSPAPNTSTAPPPPKPSDPSPMGGGSGTNTESRPATTVLRKPMRGPDLGAMFGGTPPPTFEPNDLPMMSESRKRDRDVEMPFGTNRPSKKQTGSDDEVSFGSDRLSDVVSSDESGSDGNRSTGTYGSSTSDDSSSDDEKSIRISTVPVRGRGGRGGGRGRGGRGGRGAPRGMGTKNVLTL